MDGTEVASQRAVHHPALSVWLFSDAARDSDQRSACGFTGLSARRDCTGLRLARCRTRLLIRTTLGSKVPFRMRFIAISEWVLPWKEDRRTPFHSCPRPGQLLADCRVRLFALSERFWQGCVNGFNTKRKRKASDHCARSTIYKLKPRSEVSSWGPRV
jgi:hypothetical protein